VKLSADERERLESLIHSGKHPAQKLTKARILLKADASPAGEAWSDSRIASALNTGLATIARTRRQLVEEHGDSVLELLHIPRQKFDRLICSRAYILVADEICWRWSWRAWHSWCANLSETL
jgi:hypothetical protein